MPHRPQSLLAVLFLFLFLFLYACRDHVSEAHQKQALLDTVIKDPLFNDYLTKTVELGVFLFSSFNSCEFNAAKFNPEGITTVDAYISSARGAGLPNADVVAARVQEALGLLRNVYHKYPGLLNKLSGEEREAFLNAGCAERLKNTGHRMMRNRFVKTMPCYETFTNAVASVDAISGMQKKASDQAITDFQVSSYGVFRRTLERCNATL
jgi:hypothetical protein